MAGNRPYAVVGSDAAPTSRVVRHGARVLLLDGAGRMLMVRGHDPHQPQRSFWFTPGGGIEEHESAREAAVRELAEETGYVLDVEELVGPVWRRTAVFDFFSRPYTQHEEIFVGLLADAERRPRTAAELTADETEALDEFAWLSRDQLRAEEREVFPSVLLEPWDVFTEWDGVTRELGVNPE